MVAPSIATAPRSIIPSPGAHGVARHHTRVADHRHHRGDPTAGCSAQPCVMCLPDEVRSRVAGVPGGAIPGRWRRTRGARQRRSAPQHGWSGSSSLRHYRHVVSARPAVGCLGRLGARRGDLCGPPRRPAGLGLSALFFVATILALIIIRAAIVEAFRLPSSSMSPTLEVGDHVFVDKLSPLWRSPRMAT